ncbi:hypothetical protein TorRG33x02_042090 [Trema orientale]|uniref:Uncharacterized protein n=1 Tax=Trema orientale TaxID=63057 RepID=A0A2P5FQM4_TREOI|nr:hypothetical protein TorRG33x02_042090 [Trema orientale]
MCQRGNLAVGSSWQLEIIERKELWELGLRERERETEYYRTESVRAGPTRSTSQSQPVMLASPEHDTHSPRFVMHSSIFILAQ